MGGYTPRLRTFPITGNAESDFTFSQFPYRIFGILQMCCVFWAFGRIRQNISSQTKLAHADSAYTFDILYLQSRRRRSELIELAESDKIHRNLISELAQLDRVKQRFICCFVCSVRNQKKPHAMCICLLYSKLRIRYKLLSTRHPKTSANHAISMFHYNC